jgi:tetratricopeptide (TPR) repeat protein
MREGIALYKAARYSEALEQFLKAEVTSKEHAIFSYYLGLTYSRLRRWDEALLYLEQVVTSDLGFGFTYQSRMILGYIYAETERLRMAAWEFQRILGDGYESAKVYSALAHVLYLEKNWDESLNKLERALKLEPENPNALNSMGFVLAESGTRLGQALLYCQRAVKLNPKNPAYWDSLGWVYYKLGRIKDSADILRKAVLMDPNRSGIKEHLKVVVNHHA